MLFLLCGKAELTNIAVPSYSTLLERVFDDLWVVGKGKKGVKHTFMAVKWLWVVLRLKPIHLAHLHLLLYFLTKAHLLPGYTCWNHNKHKSCSSISKKICDCDMWCCWFFSHRAVGDLRTFCSFLHRLNKEFMFVTSAGQPEIQQRAMLHQTWVAKSVEFI